MLQAFYSIRSERQLVERIEFDLLFRWFVGLGVDDPVWDATIFSPTWLPGCTIPAVLGGPAEDWGSERWLNPPTPAGQGGGLMIQDKLQRLHGLLCGTIQAMSEWRGVLPPSTSTDTAFALGEALMVLAKDTALVTWDIDQE